MSSPTDGFLLLLLLFLSVIWLGPTSGFASLTSLTTFVLPHPFELHRGGIGGANGGSSAFVPGSSPPRRRRRDRLVAARSVRTSSVVAATAARAAARTSATSTATASTKTTKRRNRRRRGRRKNKSDDHPAGDDDDDRNGILNIARELQTECRTPTDVLLRCRGARSLGRFAEARSPSSLSGEDVGTADLRDEAGRMASLTLVRLSKMMVAVDNEARHCRAVSSLSPHAVNGDGDVSGGSDRKNEWGGNAKKKENVSGGFGSEWIQLSSDERSSMVETLAGICGALAGYVESMMAAGSASTTMAVMTADERTGRLDVAVEGMKAASVVCRLLPASIDRDARVRIFAPLAAAFGAGLGKDDDGNGEHSMTVTMEPHHLSGLRWAYDGLAVGVIQGDHANNFDRNGKDVDPSIPEEAFQMPAPLVRAHDELRLPFRIHPGLLLPCRAADSKEGVNGNIVDEVAPPHLPRLTVPNLQSEVNFRSDDVVTTSTGRTVRERRLTAWQGECAASVPPFAYSGQSMETEPFSPLVRRVRDALERDTGVAYDCCLLNLYPDGDSGMRYHSDPDQGTMWGYETAVVSVGSSRRFAFRDVVAAEGIGECEGAAEKDAAVQPRRTHGFVVMDGDVLEMFGDCQSRYQHTVKTAEGRGTERSSRSSLVFKRTMDGAKEDRR